MQFPASIFVDFTALVQKALESTKSSQYKEQSVGQKGADKLWPPSGQLDLCRISGLSVSANRPSRERDDDAGVLSSAPHTPVPPWEFASNSKTADEPTIR